MSSTQRGSLIDAIMRVYLSFSRSVVTDTDDSQAVQTVTLKVFPHEQPDKVERFQSYGQHSVVPKPDGGGASGAEVAIAFMGGNRSAPIGVADIDRRTKPKNYQAGESARYDDQGQYSKIARDGHHRVAKQHTMTAAGDGIAPGGLTPPDTSFELNEQLKGLAARTAQIENSHHALFDVTSRLRAIVQGVVPEVAEVAPILNQSPSGVAAMAEAIQDRAGAYLQQHMQDALGKFLTPNLAGLASVLPMGLEASISGLQGQIVSAMAANVVVGQVDGLMQQLADLTASGASVNTIASGSAQLQQQIAALTSANPIVGAVSSLRSTLTGLLDQAGPGINFLAPQQNLVQGLSRSLKLAKAG